VALFMIIDRFLRFLTGLDIALIAHLSMSFPPMNSGQVG
jgi:hypothetical protein